MKLKSFIYLISLVLINNFYIFSSQSISNILQSKFKIIFVADPRVASNVDWLERIAKDWGATGVCIRIFWGHVDTDSTPGADNWTNLDKAINTIIENQFNDKNLDIYLRICMGLQKPTWVSPTNSNFTRNDFQIRYDDSLYDHQFFEKEIPESERYPLNFVSLNSSEKMKNFLKEVLEHVNKTFADSIKIRIKEIVPTFSVSDEEEYPFAVMCGYSAYEYAAFRNYLMNIYANNLFNLTKRWNPESTWKDFNSWEDIIPGNYNWHLCEDSLYVYPKGRVDWINFRTEQLTSFINSLGEVALSFGFQMGVQIGSIYDDLIERRGWVDPTKLFEKAKSIHVADIYQYGENFDFAAQYLHSICKFWTETNNLKHDPVRFSTETNWPEFDNKEPSFLSQKWKDQLVSYYNKGAYEHYVVGWDITTERLDSCKSSYEIWRNILLSYSNKAIVNVSNQYVTHLGTEQVFYNHNTKSSTEGTFELSSKFTFTSSKSYSAEKDIITNYMIEKNPNYLNNYTSFFFTKDNNYITEKAYWSLVNNIVNEFLTNTAWDYIDDIGKFLFTYGIKNEYNEIYSRSPINNVIR